VVCLRYVYVSKETYSCGERGLFTWQSRPRSISILQICLGDGCSVRAVVLHVHINVHVHIHTHGVRVVVPRHAGTLV